MTHETFINYKSWRWFWISLAGIVAAIIFYCINDPILPQSGSTEYGYTLGIICGVLMVYLLWYGSRKRSYFSKFTTLREVLSAHIWIGIALLFLIPLHTGFRFHWNVHTYTFIFCILTIITGIWGTYFYRVLPKEISSNRGEGSLKTHIEQFNSNTAEIVKLNKATEGRLESFISFVDNIKLPTVITLLLGKRAVCRSHLESSDALSMVTNDDRASALKVIELADKKFEVIQKIEKEVMVQTWLKLWLYFHVPLACGAGILLIIHIIVVLYFG